MSDNQQPVKYIFQMTREERDKMMKDNPPVIEEFHSFHTYFDWGWKGCGFGQFSISKNKDGSYSMSNECMSKERCRTILYAAVDAILEKVSFE